MIISRNGTIVGSVPGQAAFTAVLAASPVPIVVVHSLGHQPSTVDFVDAAGIPHDIDWTCDTAPPYSVHLPALAQAGTLTVR